MNNPYKGMEGYFTERAQKEMKQLILLGCSEPLAAALLDYLVSKGVYEESDIYEMEEKENHAT